MTTMDLTLPVLMRLVRDTLRDPRGTARGLLAMGLPVPARWIALALIAAISAILAHLAFALSAARAPVESPPLPSPLMTAALQYAVLVGTAVAVHLIGRRFGGRGTLPDSVLVVVWLQFILVVVQVAQLVALVVLPPLADVFSVAGLVLFLWLLTAFVAELHGFDSLGRVFGGILISLFALAFALALVVTLLFGVAPAAR
jgi:hypothetical protein